MIRCSRHLRCRLIADSSAPFISNIVPEERNDQSRNIARDKALKASCDVWSESKCSACKHADCCHDKIKNDTEYSCNYNVQKDSELKSSRLGMLSCECESPSFRVDEVNKESNNICKTCHSDIVRTVQAARRIKI